MEKNHQLQQKARYQLDSFLADCGVKAEKNKKILEIGFKNGVFLNECRKAQLIPTGIEIDKKYCGFVNSKYPDLNVLWYDGSTIPLPDESFDFVVSYQVLEHVGSIERMLGECIRVLKPGGIMYHVCPNYHSFYEGHCKVIWLPFLNKTMGRVYLKLLRRYKTNYETLNLVKPKTIDRVLKNYRDEIKVVSLGAAEFVNNFNLEQIEKVNQKLIQRILKLILRSTLLKKSVLAFASWAQLYYPITIIAKKTILRSLERS